LKKIYAPWREGYINKAVKKTNEQRMKAKCVFCEQLEQNNDDENFILKRYEHTFIIFNRYPYNGGHLMALPLAHKGTLDELTKEERSELIESVNLCVENLKKALNPQGFNIGLNMGKAGGGGIPSHLHFHVLPRWEGDTSFVPLLSDTKPVSVDLTKLFKDLKKLF